MNYNFLISVFKSDTHPCMIGSRKQKCVKKTSTKHKISVFHSICSSYYFFWARFLIMETLREKVYLNNADRSIYTAWVPAPHLACLAHKKNLSFLFLPSLRQCKSRSQSMFSYYYNHKLQESKIGFTQLSQIKEFLKLNLNFNQDLRKLQIRIWNSSNIRKSKTQDLKHE